MPTLINRIEPYPLESLSSLMERLRRANYYEEPAWYRLLLPSPLREPLDHLSSAPHYQALSKITGLAPERLYEHTIHQLLRAYQDSRSSDSLQRFWDKSGRDSYLHGQDIAKLCPLCWRDTKAFFIPWVSRQVTTCPTHQVLLVDSCPTCKKSLRIDRSRGVCRDCGISLADIPVISIREHPDSQSLTTLVWGALGYPSALLPPLPQLANDHPVCKMSPSCLLEFLWASYHLLQAYDPINPIFHSSLLLPGTTWAHPPRILRQALTSEIHGALTSIWRLLHDWPITWERTLERLLLRSYRPQNARTFPSVMAERFKGEDYPWLHQSWADFVRRKMLDDPAIVPWLRYYKGMQNGSLPLDTPPLLSQKEAARELGVSEERLKGFASRGMLLSTAVLEKRGARQWQLIEGSTVKRLLLDRSKHLTLWQTAKLIHTSKEKVGALVAAGLLEAVEGPLADGSPIWRFDPEVVLASLQRLIGHLPVKTPTTEWAHGERFAWIQQAMTRYKKRLPHLLVDIQRGALQMYRVEDVLNLSTLWCESQALQAYQEAVRQSAFDLLSVNMVCERLGCKPTTLRRLYAVGLLVPISDDTDSQEARHQYAQEDVTAFLEQYITSDEAAEVLGVVQLTVQSWARSGRITAVTGPEIDGSHAYRFEKAALARWRHERLTFGEAIALLGVSKATLHRWAEQGRITPLEDMDGKQRWFARAAVERLIG